MRCVTAAKCKAVYEVYSCCRRIAVYETYNIIHWIEKENRSDLAEDMSDTFSREGRFYWKKNISILYFDIMRGKHYEKMDSNVV